MLEEQTLTEISTVVHNFWRHHLINQTFKSISQGKEIGHKIADYVDEKTTSLIDTSFLGKVGYEWNKSGIKRQRSMGDLWFQDNDLYHPINVKTGIVGHGGQPNIVALAKLLVMLLARKIDSYYLLIIKIGIENDVPNEVNVFFYDLLDILDYIHFDAGPGQLMLKNDKFFSALNTSMEIDSGSLPKKIEQLISKYDTGVYRLIMNRRARLIKINKLYKNYAASKSYGVTPENQQSLNIRLN